MTAEPKLMTAEEVRALVVTAVVDPAVDLSIPLQLSLALREGLRPEALRALNRGDYHPAVNEAPGSLTYRDGDQVRVASLSPESELLLAAYLAQ